MLSKVLLSPLFSQPSWRRLQHTGQLVRVSNLPLLVLSWISWENLVRLEVSN